MTAEVRHHDKAEALRVRDENRAAELTRLRALADSCAVSILGRLIANYETDRDQIADGDLDNEQPIAITFRGQLGDIRNARKALGCLSRITEINQDRRSNMQPS